MSDTTTTVVSPNITAIRASDLPTTRVPYQFQLEGIDWLASRGYGFLWDDPGLGKTMQAIIASRMLCPNRPKLIVCPNMVKLWWAREIAALYPADKKRIAVSRVGGRFYHHDGHSGSEILPHYYWKHHPDTLWFITHYAGARICKDSLVQVEWPLVVLDEAHYIKNRTAQRTHAIMQITPRRAYRIGLTATPFGKNPADVWSQLRWMSPENEPLNSYWRFFNHFVDYSSETHPTRGHHYKKVNGGKNLDHLARLMSAYGVQRTKAEVAPQMPAIVDTDMPLEAEGRQLKVYEELRNVNRVELVIGHTENGGGVQGEGGITGLVITNALARLARMEQWLSCPWEFDPGMIGAKLTWVKEWAESYPLPAVILTAFKSSAHRVAKELGTQAITGDMPHKLRDGVIKRWKEGEQFLVGTIHTMGTGLNLQEAHMLVFYDQLYNPILMTQARDRVHRIDSDHPVEVVYLFVQGSSNEVVLNAFRLKWTQMQLVRVFLRYLRTGVPMEVNND